MKYLKLFESFGGNNHYFVTIFDILYPNITQEEALKDKKFILPKMIQRAFVNLDSKGYDKVDGWLKTATGVVDNFIKKGHHKTDQQEEDAKSETIRTNNLKFLSNTPGAMEEIAGVGDYYLEEVGIDVIMDYLKREDGIQFSKSNIDFSQELKQREGEDIVDFIKRDPKHKHTWETIKNKLTKYYIKSVSRSIPRDVEFSDHDEMLSWLKTQSQKFLYEYMIPMSNNG